MAERAGRRDPAPNVAADAPGPTLAGGSPPDAGALIYEAPAFGPGLSRPRPAEPQARGVPGRTMARVVEPAPQGRPSQSLSSQNSQSAAKSPAPIPETLGPPEFDPALAHVAPAFGPGLPGPRLIGSKAAQDAAFRKAAPQRSTLPSSASPSPAPPSLGPPRLGSQRSAPQRPSLPGQAPPRSSISSSAASPAGEPARAIVARPGASAPQAQSRPVPQAQATPAPQVPTRPALQAQATPAPKASASSAAQVPGSQASQAKATPALQTKATLTPQAQAIMTPKAQDASAPQTQATPVPQARSASAPQTQATPVPQARSASAPQTKATPTPKAPQTQASPASQAQTTPALQAQAAPALQVQATPASQAQAASAPKAKVAPKAKGILAPPPAKRSKGAGVLRFLALAASLTLLSALLAWSVIYAINLARGRPEVKAPANLQVLPLTPPPPAGIALDKAALAELLGARELPADPGGLLELKGPDGQTLYARTTLDPVLQAKALELVAQAGAVRAALVVVDPATGRVLALAGAGRDGGNAALSGTYPAASVFKMVTAAAAVERASLTSDSVINYDGAKHTLYKANVVKGLDQGTHRTTLRTGFAQSVNSVFGKIGALAVGGQGLARTADNFGFNRALPFEMPLEASTFALGTTGSLAPPATPPAGDYEETPESALPEATLEEAGGAPAGESDLDSEIFHLAELASGFNRATRISPVHGALMAAAAVNGGTLYEPTVIDEVFTRANEILYQGVSIPAGPAVMAETAAELRDMMHATVLEGTGRKRLSDALEQPVLSRLELGGKSGSINDDDGSRVDWFVAFANPREPDSTAPPLALAAVVVHQGGFRLASQDLVRRALLVYYGDRL